MRRRRRPGSTFTSASGPGPRWRARPTWGVPWQPAGILGLGRHPLPAEKAAGGIGFLVALSAVGALVVPHRPRTRRRRCRRTEVGHSRVLANCRRRCHFPHLGCTLSGRRACRTTTIQRCFRPTIEVTFSLSTFSHSLFFVLINLPY